MSEHFYEDVDDVLPAQPNGELVHWMDPRPMAFGPGALSAAVLGAFAAGLGAAILAISLAQMVRRERRMSAPLERKLRRLN
jgi:hypothetical protein